MAQYFYDQLHCLARPGGDVPSVLSYTGDFAFFPVGKGLSFRNNHTSIRMCIISIPCPQLESADVMIRFRQLVNPTDYYLNTGLGIVYRLDSSVNGLAYISFPSAPEYGLCAGLAKTVNGLTSFPQGNLSVPGRTLGVWHWMRAKLVGSSFQLCTSLEELPPLGAAATVNLSGVPTTGSIGIICMSYFAGFPIYEVSSIAIGTDDDVPPTSATGCANVSSLSGTVTDHEGNPCAREVRVFLRCAGRLHDERHRDRGLVRTHAVRRAGA